MSTPDAIPARSAGAASMIAAVADGRPAVQRRSLGGVGGSSSEYRRVGRSLPSDGADRKRRERFGLDVVRGAGVGLCFTGDLSSGGHRNYPRARNANRYP
jgi:hypothetical protein